MKYLLVLSCLFIVVACNKKPTEDPAETVINPQAADSTERPESEAQEEESMGGGIVEENTMCICTKEYNPVCANGQTFPSPCQAKCDGITDYTEGACK